MLHLIACRGTTPGGRATEQARTNVATRVDLTYVSGTTRKAAVRDWPEPHKDSGFPNGRQAAAHFRGPASPSQSGHRLMRAPGREDSQGSGRIVVPVNVPVPVATNE